MKRTTSSRSLTSEQVQEAIAAAPDAVTDANTPYNPNDAASVTKFWKEAVVTKSGGVANVTAQHLQHPQGKAGLRGLLSKPLPDREDRVLARRAVT